MPTLIDKYKSQYPWLKTFIHLKGTDLCVGEVDPSKLPPNPKNWRIHSQRQRATYKAFQEKFGYLGMALFNVRTNHLLDGHMRVDEALKAKTPRIPLMVVDFEESSENEVLATLDNIGLMAITNNEALRSLTKSVDKAVDKVKTENERKLKQLRKDLLDTNFGSKPILKQSQSRLRPLEDQDSSSPSPEESEGSEEDESVPTDHYESAWKDGPIQTFINPAILYDGLTELGIPELSKENLATPDLAPTCTYPDDPAEQAYHCYSQSFSDEYDPGCIGFYTEDHKFECVYNQAAEFVEWAINMNPRCLIGPDFSCYTHWPLAKNIWNLYRARWCTRLWQDAGLKVIPNVPILDGPPYTLSTKYSLETLPTKATLAVQCRTQEARAAKGVVEWINRIIEVCKPVCMVLYAGEEKQKYMLGDLKKGKTQLIFLPQIVTVKRKRYK
jgi:hypothetical protein